MLMNEKVRSARGFVVRRRGFTLIELLVAIAILGVLAVITIPALSKALSSAKKARAMREVTELDGAIKRFIGEYGKPPLPRGKKIGEPDQEFTGESQADILQILMNLDDGWGVEERNTRQLVFLELDPASFGTKTQRHNPGESQPCVECMLKAGDPYRDPWGKPYGVLLDMNMDDRITGLPYGAGTIRAKVGVYSLGEGGEANKNNPPYKTW